LLAVRPYIDHGAPGETLLEVNIEQARRRPGRVVGSARFFPNGSSDV
jgi:hypothetical protein